MPALPVVPQVCDLKISGVYHDAIWMNKYYLHYSGAAPSNSDILDYLVGIESGVEAAYGAEMSVDNECTEFQMTDLTSDTGSENALSLSFYGVRTGDFQPASVAMVASMEIARRYRGGHPRKYLPWGTSGTMASGSTKDWDPDFVGDCQTKFDTLMTNLVGITFGATTWDEIVNVSYVTAKARRTDALVDVVVGHIIRPRICTQRRRLGKIGG